MYPSLPQTPNEECKELETAQKQPTVIQMQVRCEECQDLSVWIPFHWRWRWRTEEPYSERTCFSCLATWPALKTETVRSQGYEKVNAWVCAVALSHVCTQLKDSHLRCEFCFHRMVSKKSDLSTEAYGAGTNSTTYIKKQMAESQLY